MSGTVWNQVGRTVFQLGFQISPILLTNGLFSDIPGGMMPIVAITESISLVGGLLRGDFPSLDEFFAHFSPASGGSLISYQYGRYPFANQTVAANAAIKQPNRVSLKMITPVNRPGGNTFKFLTMMVLQRVLDRHISQGGTFTVVTPAFLYTNMLLLDLRDISAGEQKIPQNEWLWEFEQPLITLADAAAAQNSLMSKLTAGVPTDGSITGPSVATDQLTGGASAGAPGAANLEGAAAGGYQSAATVPVTSTPLPP